ncbi:Uncharacterised protein [Vibrio cholerae]|nr:Uncharacterised protein [Vibrio cholerae]
MAANFVKGIFNLIVIIPRSRACHFVGGNQVQTVFGNIEILLS